MYKIQKMNSKKVLIWVASLLWIAWLGLAGWYVWDNYQGNSWTLLNSLLPARQVNFSESYNILVDWFTKDYVDASKKIQEFKNVKEDLSMSATWNYEQYKWNMNLAMSGLYTNSWKIVDNKWLMDFTFDWNVDLPSQSTWAVDNLWFSWAFSFLMSEWKMLITLKSFALNSANPQIMMMGGFANAYLNKWILLLDYLWTGQNVPFNPTMSTQDSFEFIYTISEWLKKYQLVSQTWEATKQWDYTLYRTELNKDNIVNFYKEILNSKLVSSMSWISSEELQKSVIELSWALANANVWWTMKVKDSNNIVFEFDTITWADSYVNWKIYRDNNRYAADFTFTPKNTTWENLVLNVEKIDALKIRWEYFGEGKSMWIVALSVDWDLNNDNVKVNWNVNWNIDKINFNVNLNETLNLINEISSWIFVVPQNYTKLEELLPAF